MMGIGLIELGILLLGGGILFGLILAVVSLAKPKY